jgi:two-component system, chemotaxis family, response regulator PixG
MVSYRPFQSLHPLSLLAQSISRQTSGCLHITSGDRHWGIYLNRGKLTYATHSIDPFERLDRHLRQLSRQVPSLVSAVRVQVRLLFEGIEAQIPYSSADHQAIAWLVEQHYLSLEQAHGLIEGLAKEVLEPLLAVNEGRYEVIEHYRLEAYPDLCELELRPLVEECQRRSRSQGNGQGSRIASVGAAPLRESDSPAQQAFQRLQSVTTPTAQPAAYTAPSAIPSMIPRTEMPDLRMRSPQLSVVQPAPLPIKTRYTIACIDDSPTILQAINSFLDDTSFSVLMISDPVKALMQVVRNRPDLILLDVGMPNLDGYELCSLLRRHPSFKTTPIVMVTGNTGFIDRAKAKLVGASGYLTKPFTQSELLKMVFKHLTPA